MENVVDFEFEEAVPDTPALVLGKKKKKKKSEKGETSGAKTGTEDISKPANALQADEGELVEDLNFLALRANSDMIDQSPPLPLDLTKKKKKKKNKVEEFPVQSNEKENVNDSPGKEESAGASSMFAHLDDENVAEEVGSGHDLADGVALDPPQSASNERSSEKSSQKKKKGKKDQTPAAVTDDDIDAILAELDEKPSVRGSEEPAENSVDDSSEKPVGGSKKKKGKKQSGGETTKSKHVDDDLDALLAELDEPSKVTGSDNAVTTLVPPLDSAKSPTGNDIDAMMAELEDGAGDEGTKQSAASKKKKKKGKGKSSAVVGDTGQDVDEDAEGAASVDIKEQAATSIPGAKKGKKESAAVKRIREQRERMAAEEARLEKLRQEEEAKRLEEERIENEREEARLRARQAKKNAEKARKERRKAEGKILSKAEAAKRRKAEAFKEQALAQGRVPAAAPSGDSAVAGTTELVPGQIAKQVTQEPGRIIYSKKKKKKPVTGEDVDTAEDADEDTDPSQASRHQSTDPSVTEMEEVVPEEWDVDVAAQQTVTGDGETQPLDSETYQTVDKRGENDSINTDNESKNNSTDGTSESASDTEDSEHEGLSRAEIAAEKRRDALRRKRQKELVAAKAARTPNDLRSPIICILGHVDTGKTKILDRIRRTNVQDGEAGGITQQIGATYFPIDAVKKETNKLKEGRELPYNVPSLLIIDTPGHESFTNLRSRGSSLCDIAILVVDIMHGLEPQTRESIDLLKLRKTPFIVALNKVDRLYDWQEQAGNCPIRESLEKQKGHVCEEFIRRTKDTQLEFAKIGFNTALYWENDDFRRTISFVPTSAITGEGIPDLLMLILSLTQKLLTERLMFCPILEATVLEVKVIEGLGTTIDIVLTGGTVRAGDTIFVVGLDGPIQTTIRALLTPHPMKEMRVKGQYLHHKEIRAAQGIKISAEGLDKAVAGTQVLVAKDSSDEDEVEFLKEEVMKDFTTILQNVDKSGLGVYVQASTLGSLEALLEFLRTSSIPVSGINIGPVHKRDVTKASTMLEKKKEFATILAFDVPVEREARELAEELGVRIFTADIIYHLFDQFTLYMEEMKKARREEINDSVVFPCILKILPQHIFNKKDPIILGVDVAEGILRVGTPLVVRHGTGWLDIGRAVSIELNKKSVVVARRGESVALKVQSARTEHIMYGRHFDWQDSIVSKMSRAAINILKENFRDDLSTDDWRLVKKLKMMFEII